MRRALRKQLPALTRFYGIAPSEWDDMPLGEVDEFVSFFDEHLRHMEKQAREQEKAIQKAQRGR